MVKSVTSNSSPIETSRSDAPQSSGHTSQPTSGLDETAKAQAQKLANDSSQRVGQPGIGRYEKNPNIARTRDALAKASHTVISAWKTNTPLDFKGSVIADFHDGKFNVSIIIEEGSLDKKIQEQICSNASKLLNNFGLTLEDKTFSVVLPFSVSPSF